jgi:hypothetical protein
MDWNWIAPTLVRSGVALTPLHSIESISAGSTEVYHLYGDTTVTRATTSVVLALARVPEDGLYRSLQSTARVSLLGDALAPRSLEAVIYEAETSAREFS